MSWDILQKLVLPDPWQTEAIDHLVSGQDVIVDAPTGAGKTYIFEKLVEREHLRRVAIYTVPTRALANDKFAEWRARGWPVGLVTGDISEATAAPILVATLEAARPILMRQPPGLLVVDEYQWIGDFNRGNHFEAAIMQCPATTQLLLMSGCVANPEDLFQWLRRLGRNAQVVKHRFRPVPLEEMDADRLIHGLPSSIEGFWAKRIAGALREGLGPILIFVPHRHEAERLARQFARELPNPHPLTLSDAQRQLVPPELAKLLEARVAYHHSGLTYLQRAGVVEPLAKAGQLRAVVATLGLSAGINFSLRSVLITASTYQHDGMDHFIPGHDLLQMAGRAGRRGLDEIGYFLFSRDTPRLDQARQIRLKRATPLPWPPLLQQLHAENSPQTLIREFSGKLFTHEPPSLGMEEAGSMEPTDFPCGQILPTSRARLVRRTRRPFKGCRTCPQRPTCLTLSPDPTLIWHWKQLGLISRKIKPTPRGTIASYFYGPEGLAIAAALDNPEHRLDDLVFDLADLFAAGRFCGSEPRWIGRLADSCRKAYGRLSIDGWLIWGVPIHYGFGGTDVLLQVLNRAKRKSQLTGETAGVGDIDRLVIEWWSLLRQISHAPEDGPERWPLLQAEARAWLEHRDRPQFPELPPLTAEQSKQVEHRLRTRITV